ncbi:SDR family NAD(P)-dependent oxidoreductase [Falsirhodobacter halotolerans]|uniref:SDR family NAD(P)-dependent oxidoreductase n=1 Tax=Falsirhodobacter halotolerans TaxID=1146892 RepID=UPI001FD3C0D2|nr:SDR family oxidoreductase [Falsirhodobacter halotolerans]MCJ8139187.1 SDR family oxidoreductase [Falsirhodobacter halotolerans]
MDLGIKGRRALITGASGGMGRETARFLAAEGVKLFLTDIDDDKLAPIAAEFDAEYAAGDLSSQKGCEEFLAKSGTDFDIWVHATGVTGGKGDPLHMSEDDWSDALNIDFLSAVRMARHMCPPMMDRGWGRVVFVTSENVAQPYPDETVYNSAKSALLSFAKSIAMQHSHSGMLVNCVAPAFIETPMTDGMMEKRSEERGESFDEAVESFLKEQRPYLVLKRRGKAEEVAAVIAMLCSDHASFVTGANWRVDGGAVGSINV